MFSAKVTVYLKNKERTLENCNHQWEVDFLGRWPFRKLHHVFINPRGKFSYKILIFVHLLFVVLATGYLGCLLDDTLFFAEFVCFERFIARTLYVLSFHTRLECKNEWMSEQMDEWTNEWVSEWIKAGETFEHALHQDSYFVYKRKR